jgi:hypothetical protein
VPTADARAPTLGAVNSSRARTAHLVVAVVTGGALLLQLVLVVQGGAVLVEEDPPGLGARLGRFVLYFTVQCNALVALSAATLALDPHRDGPGWRALRLAALVGITITAVVHFVLLRPLLDLDGLDLLADALLHRVVPVLAVGTWLVWGPRPRIDGRAIGLALLWPIAWLALTFVVRGLTGWVPYPFLDPDEDGWGAVAVACVGITVLFLAVCAGAHALDRRMRAAPTAG